MNYKLIVIIIIISAIPLAGLGCKAECKLARECDDGNACTRDSCANRKCVYMPIADCHIGDSVCDREEGENECNAPQDCGACKGEATKYLSYQCNKDQECVIDIAAKVTEEVFSELVTEKSGLGMSMTYKYESPFDVDRALFKVKFDLESSPNTISDVKIKKIQLLEKSTTVTRVLGDKDIDRPLFRGVPVGGEVPLKIPTTDTEKEIKPTVKVIYEFLENKQTKKTVTYEKTLSSAIVLVDPSAERSCPECNDENPCTEDSCSEETDYFCEYIPLKRACCGNFVCDAGENECTCYRDCGYCERDYGLYMYYRCANNQCSPAIKDPGVIKPKTFINDISFGDFQTEVKTTIDEPFNIKGSRIKVDMEAKVINVGIKNIKCRKLQLVEGNELLGEADVNIALVQTGQVGSALLTLNDFLRMAEESHKPALKISCEYDKEYRGSLQHSAKTQSINLEQIIFVSPK